MKYGNLEITINMITKYYHNNNNKQNKRTTKNHHNSALQKTQTK